MPWNPWVQIEEDSTSNEVARVLYDHARNKRTGTVPDLVRLTSLSPEVSRLLHDLSIAVLRQATGLTIKEKEIAALIVASWNGCVH